MTEETGTELDDSILILIDKLQGQRFVLGDKMVKMILKTAIKTGRMKAKDKDEYNRVLSENTVFQEFCRELGLRL